MAHPQCPSSPSRGGIEIIRTMRRSQYEIIPHDLIRDSRLSYRARGIAIRLLSNVDGYRMTSDDLAQEGVEGREAVRAGLLELEQVGYLKRTRMQNEKGHWMTKTVLRDTCEIGATAVTDDGNSGVGSPTADPPTPRQPRVGRLGVKSKSKSISSSSITTSTRVAQDREHSPNLKRSEPPLLHHGLLVFGDRDRGQIDELAREYGSQRVAEAADAVRRKDKRGRIVAYVSEARRWLQRNRPGNGPSES